jgi:hypothetical protein
MGAREMRVRVTILNQQSDLLVINILNSKRHFMKTYNHHPQWYNQPLRLKGEQKHDPFLVFEDFFECYHLNEVREILWRWMEEVVCSPHSISSDLVERCNHIYFYEKIEELVEAAFMLEKLKRKALRKRNRNHQKKTGVDHQ